MKSTLTLATVLVTRRLLWLVVVPVVGVLVGAAVAPLTHGVQRLRRLSAG